MDHYSHRLKRFYAVNRIGTIARYVTSLLLQHGLLLFYECILMIIALASN
jgi:hypothetical protein